MMKHIYSLIIVLTAVFCNTVNSGIVIPEGCENKLSERNRITATDENGKLLYNFTDCTDVTNNLPEVCNVYGGMGQQCCEACFTIDTSCLDTKLKRWILNDITYNCSGYAALEQCNCADPVVKENCCASCNGKDISNCATPTTEPVCGDSLSPDNPITMTFGTTTIELGSCTDMVDKYRILCLQFGLEGMKCCKSCQGIDMGCLDKPIAINDKVCADYVLEDPCRCNQMINNEKVSDSCCHSCKEAKIPKNCCKDRLSDTNTLPVLDPVTKETTAVLTSCDQILDHPTLCENEAVNGEFGYCCETCRKLLGGKLCIDFANVTITQGENQYNCAEFVALDDPCNCLLIENAKKQCCRSCFGKDTSGCKCRDLLSPENKLTFEISDLEFDSCADLAPDHLDLCKQLGGKGEACCMMCQNVDTKCVDNSLIKFTTPDGMKRNCASYIASDVCNCKDTKECCASCKDVNTTHCKCYDPVSPVYPLRVSAADGNIIETVHSCGRLIDEYPSQCANPAIGKKEGRCCEACKAIPHPNCLDDKKAVFTINGNPFSCEQLIGISNCFCTDTIEGIDVKAVCCASCKGQDFNECKCRDMLRQEIPIDIKDSSDKIIDRVTSCQELVAKYPAQCEEASGRGGMCCRSCKAVPNPTCLNLLTQPIILSATLPAIRTCDELADNYPELCRQLGGPGKLCCQACKRVDTRCLDTVLRSWNRGDSVYDCAGWVELEKCHCADSSVATDCCQSCKTIIKRGLLDNVDCDCRDTLHPDHKVTVTVAALGNKVFNVTSCNEVQQSYKWLCADTNIAPLCCKTCKKINTTCLNENVVFNGVSSCAQFIAEDKCHCTETISGRKVSEVCCAACSKRDTASCACRNTLSSSNPLRFSDGKEITSCRTLKVKKYHKLCEMYGKPGGVCCEACVGIETMCADDPLVNFFYKSDPETKYSCPAWIKADPCHCFKPETKEKCCISCLMINTDHCACRDSVSPLQPIIANVTNKVDGSVRTVVINSCLELKTSFPASCPQFGGKGNVCCQTCPDPCQNNPNWIGTIGKRKKSRCVDCDCEKVAKKKRILRAACCDNTMGYKENCCLSCKKIKC